MTTPISQPRQQTPVVEILGLSVGYGKKILFKEVDLTMQPGQLICFMGPNGIGKSTLMRTIAGLTKPLNGVVIFQGDSLLRERLVSLVLTDPVLAGYMTVEDVVTFGRYPYLGWDLKLTSHDTALIEFAFEEVNIQHLRTQIISQLSDGQKQMAMIARAIAQDTPVILLDEPTAHLDLNNRVEVMRLLKRLTKTMGKSILLATHELDLALQTADLIWLAARNQKILTGIPEDLVLKGVFDSIFEFKGFDLRTGKMQHDIFRSTRIGLSGHDHPYLWTRNLLERHGFQVVDAGDINVTIDHSDEELLWRVEPNLTFRTLQDFINHLLQRSPD